MKAKELIERLEREVAANGDRDVAVDISSLGVDDGAEVTDVYSSAGPIWIQAE